jgi:tRNA(Ile)-lysidine synthase
MSSLVQQFSRHWAAYRQARCVLACSGGPDSVALLLLARHAQRLPGQLSVAHFHHGLRGRDADNDAEFVSELCRRLEVPCAIGRADGRLLERESCGEGLESAARRQRYRFLTATAEQLGARYVAAGHTADDQAETVLHHVLRGTGLAGLAGIRPTRLLSSAVTLVRPLLAFTREELLEYLRGERQEYREDEHNRELKFLRSRIRNQLLPLLEADYYADVRRSLRRLACVAHAAQAVIRPLAESLLDQCLTNRSPNAVQLDCRPMGDAAEHLCREAFVCLWRRQDWPQQSMTFDHWQRLAETARASEPPRAFVLPGALRAERRAWVLNVAQLSPSPPSGEGLGEGPGEGPSQGPSGLA